MFKFSKRRFSKKDKERVELRALKIALAVLVGLMLAGGVALWQVNKDETRIVALRQEAQQVQPQQTVPPNTSKIGGPFNLTDQDGKKVTDAKYRGKYLLVYFGYTYCPDLCPTGLQSIAHALDQLGDDAKKVQPLYVTIDPARDTPAKLKEYIASFHPQIVGLTGTAAQIASVAKEYQVYYARGEQVDEHDYIMDHSSLIYLMDPQGNFVTTFPEEVDPTAIVKALHEAWKTDKDKSKG
jgi:protein SCO1/2